MIHLRHAVFSRLAWCLASLLLSTAGQAQVSTTEILPPGFRPVPPGVHALINAKVVVKPGQVIERATIVVRDGFIQSVGRDVQAPSDARAWDMQGLTVYAGLIDPYLVLPPRTAARPAAAETEAAALTDDSENLTAGGGIGFYGVNPQQREAGDNTGPGYEVARVTPERRVAQTFSPDAKALSALREAGFTSGNVVPDRGIIRGTSAFVALSDTDPGRAIIKPDVFQHVALENGGGRRGEGGGGGGRGNAYPVSLMGDIAVIRQSFFDTEHYGQDQADYRRRPRGRARPEFNVSLEALAPAADKKMPVVFEPRDALLVDRCARIARELNLDYYILSTGQEWRRPELAKAAEVPFIVPLNFPTLPRLTQEDDWDQASLDQLRAWDWAAENAAVLNKQGLEIALTTHGLSNKADFRRNLRMAIDRGLSESNALAGLTTVPARLCGVDRLLGTVEAGKQANLTVVDGNGYFDPEAKIRAVWIDGRIYPAPPDAPRAARGDPPNADSTATTNAPARNGEGRASVRREQLRNLQKTRVARSPMEERGVLANPPAVLVRNATVWTSGPQGKIDDGFLLVARGKISAVGPMSKLVPTSMPAGTMVIDGTGLHVSAGLIDCHSHSMILGGVNEGSLPSSAMVRISDVINSESANIYQQLAGGLTVANELHGSANPIGGQNQVIKLRDGEPPEGLKLEGAPPGIKFALGENVKQSSRTPTPGTTARFPQTRMGVQTFLANRFTAGQQYLKDWADYKKSGGAPPRRDLELEAIGEILEGKRLIHCHSYRQDEILAFLRLMEEFGVKVATLQHILEGYKVADEIAKHGAGASSFADWWAYKFEVWDAIPYNGSLMRDRGVLVSFNSDSADLARRLYTEAAKAVKFGGTSEIEALKFVTINPAMQLRIDKMVGSLEVGKDGDFVIWTKAPLDSTTMCFQTWIDGKKYFDSQLNPARAAALAKERADLITKAKQLAAQPGGAGTTGAAAENAPEDNSFFRVSLEHQYDGIDRHCLDEN